MTDGLMTFGRHRGELASEVPLEYLLWAVSSLADPAPCVVEELKRRSEQHGMRGAIEAAAAVSSLLYKRQTKRGKKRRGKWLRGQIKKNYRNRVAT